MTVKVSKPAINVREELADLRKPSGVAGEAMLRAETPQEQFNLIGAGRRNILINGDFQVSQRGDYTTAYAYSYANYTVDRWKLYDVGCDGRVTHKVKQQVNNRYTNTLYLECVTGGTGRLISRQLVEQPEGYSTHQLDGVTGTASAWVKSNSRKARLYIYGGFYVNVAHSGSGEWEYLTTTITGTTADSPIEVGVQIDGGSNNNTSISVGDYFEVAYIQLEYGKVATPFEHRSYGEELAACQRYYYKTDTIIHIVAPRYSGSAGSGNAWWKHPVCMRASPAMSYHGTWSATSGYGGAPTFGNITKDGVALTTSVSTTANGVLYLTGGQISGNAEL